MSGFFTIQELAEMGFASIGTNVKISRKASLYKVQNMNIGNNVRIEDYCVLNGDITLGDNVMICVYCLLDGNSGIEINDNVTMAARCSIHSGSDDYSGKSLFGCFAPRHLRKYRIGKKVVIKKHCLLGDSTIILPGTTLNEGTAVGANSLIKEDTEEWSIYAGSPAKKIKSRSRDILVMYKNVQQNM